MRGDFYVGSSVGGHSEVDITDAIDRVKDGIRTFPSFNARPFEVPEVTPFLVSKISRFFGDS